MVASLERIPGQTQGFGCKRAALIIKLRTDKARAEFGAHFWHIDVHVHDLDARRVRFGSQRQQGGVTGMTHHCDSGRFLADHVGDGQGDLPGLIARLGDFRALVQGAPVARSVLAAGAGAAWAFSNPDVQCVALRRGTAGNPDRIKMLQALLLCLRGTVMLDPGEELGLPHSDAPRHRLQDPEALRLGCDHRSRDGARTFFPWAGKGVSFGFSYLNGWLPANDPIILCEVS